MKEFFIKSILKFLFGLTSAQWQTAIQLVISLAQEFHVDNDTRASRFIALFTMQNPEHKTWVLETLRNLAVGFARTKGWI